MNKTMVMNIPMPIMIPMLIPSFPCSDLQHVPGFKQIVSDRDVEGLEPLDEPGPNAVGPETPSDRSPLIYPCLLKRK